MTRGTTAANRLRRVDRWITAVYGPLLRRHDRPLVVDLGYGASPVTTMELFTRLRRVNPRVEVVGIEIDPARVAAARAYRLPKTLIHRNVPGEPVHSVLTAFDQAWASAAPRSVFGARQRWIAAVELLARSHPVHTVPPLGGRARWRLGEATLPWSAVAPRD